MTNLLLCDIFTYDFIACNAFHEAYSLGVARVWVSVVLGFTVGSLRTARF